MLVEADPGIITNNLTTIGGYAMTIQKAIEHFKDHKRTSLKKRTQEGYKKLLELQARCGLRVGEVLNLKVSDVSQQKLMLQEPKSGREVEVAFMPEHIANRLADYIASRNLSTNDRVFGICYTTARNLVAKLGQKLNVRISPHDLRRHSATYASRNGFPLEIISKVILRHQDLKTTQVYLGKVSDSEAIRWMDVLHRK